LIVSAITDESITDERSQITEQRATGDYRGDRQRAACFHHSLMSGDLPRRSVNYDRWSLTDDHSATGDVPRERSHGHRPPCHGNLT
jgi:hypothetical protein